MQCYACYVQRTIRSLQTWGKFGKVNLCLILISLIQPQIGDAGYSDNGEDEGAGSNGWGGGGETGEEIFLMHDDKEMTIKER